MMITGAGVMRDRLIRHFDKELDIALEIRYKDDRGLRGDHPANSDDVRVVAQAAFDRAFHKTFGEL